MTHIAYYKSPVGLIEIKAEEDSITSLLFVDDVDSFSEVSLPVLHKCINQLEEYFSGKRISFDISIKQQGTDFQQVVWQKLQEIPFGKTLSYLELSRQIGNEKSIRAVGTTNGKNKIALIVPCHRVIGSDRSLTGYAGGLWRKQWLLEHEQEHTVGKWTLF